MGQKAVKHFMFIQGPCNKGSLFYLDAEKEGPGCHCRKVKSFLKEAKWF